MRKLSLLKMVCIMFVFCAATAIGSPAQILTTLHSFDLSDGLEPSAGLVQGSDGNSYGTTSRGGANGWGTVFKITPDGTLTTLYSFCAQNGCADGATPIGGLVQASDGNFYGTTQSGGAYNNCFAGGGCGTVFKITLGGTLTTLYSFCPQSGCADGANPYAGLLQATDGNFYGTTQWGGDGSCNSPWGPGCGTVFKITASGTLTTLYSFCLTANCFDGENPEAGLVQATDGNFYGTTYYGGTGTSALGTVFRITPSGRLTVLYSFCSKANCADGQNPEAGLVQATDGNFYGTTVYGGTGIDALGTVFKITPSGALTTLYSFCSQSGCADGAYPHAGLLQATDGNFYGTTYGGWAASTVFKITSSGTLTLLHTFDGLDGAGPWAGLVPATDGSFYGTTLSGGAYGAGTVFRLVSVRPCFSCALEWR